MVAVWLPRRMRAAACIAAAADAGSKRRVRTCPCCPSFSTTPPAPPFELCAALRCRPCASQYCIDMTISNWWGYGADYSDYALWRQSPRTQYDMYRCDPSSNPCCPR